MRTAGHNVVAIAETAPQTDDEDVIALAVREGRVLLTEDKDFGQLVYAGLHPSSGVILIRFPQSFRWALPEIVCKTVLNIEERLKGAFVVIRPNRVRIGRNPTGGP